MIHDEVRNLVDLCEFYKAGNILRGNLQPIMISTILNDKFNKEKIENFPLNRLKEQAVWLIPELFKNQKTCLTTNFDVVLETVYTHHRCYYISLLPENTNEKAEAHKNGKHVILKLHGGIDSAKQSIILSENDVDEYYKSGTHLSTCLETHISGNHLLFLGASLKKDYTTKKLEQLNNRPNKHFAIIPAIDENEAIKRAEELNFLNIFPMFYPCPINEPQKHEEWLPLILKWLNFGWMPYDEHEEADIEKALESEYNIYIMIMQNSMIFVMI